MILSLDKFRQRRREIQEMQAKKSDGLCRRYRVEIMKGLVVKEKFHAHSLEPEYFCDILRGHLLCYPVVEALTVRIFEESVLCSPGCSGRNGANAFICSKANNYSIIKARSSWDDLYGSILCDIAKGEEVQISRSGRSR